MQFRLNRSAWQVLRGIASTSVVVLVLFLAAIYLNQQWKNIEVYVSEIKWLDIGAAAAGFTLGMALLPISSWLIFRYAGFRVSARQVWRAFYLSQVAKYLPGSIWSLPSRVYFYSQFGVPTLQSAAIVIWESGLMVMGAVVLVAIFPSLVFGATFLPITLLVLGALVVAEQLAARQLTTPRFKMWTQTGAKIKRPLAALSVFVPTPGQTITIICAYTFAWLVIGLAFAQTAQSVRAVPGLSTWFDLAALHAAAWIVGFLVIIAPGGIGVKDTLLILGTAKVFDAPSPVIIAGLARLLWTAAELVGLLFVQLIHSARRFSRDHQTPTEE